jgi:hypothetical protein
VTTGAMEGYQRVRVGPCAAGGSCGGACCGGQACGVCMREARPCVCMACQGGVCIRACVWGL